MSLCGREAPIPSISPKARRFALVCRGETSGSPSKCFRSPSRWCRCHALAAAHTWLPLPCSCRCPHLVAARPPCHTVRGWPAPCSTHSCMLSLHADSRGCPLATCCAAVLPAAARGVEGGPAAGAPDAGAAVRAPAVAR